MDEERRLRGGDRRRRAPLRLAGLAGLAGLALVSSLAACSSASTLRKHEHEADLAELGNWLPGIYDDSLQVRAEQKAGGAPRDAVLFVIVPVYTPAIGDHVFFAESMLANDSQRVVSEQLLSFALDNEGAIIQTNYALKDPLRWRAAYVTPELFEGLQGPDLKGIVGCPLAWRRAEDRFTASNDRHSCQPRAASRAGGRDNGRGGNGAAARASAPSAAAKESTGPVLAELTADEYAVLRRLPGASASGAGGAGPPATAVTAVAGTHEDTFERFRKRVQP
jgi:hypothetical protein